MAVHHSETLEKVYEHPAEESTIQVLDKTQPALHTRINKRDRADHLAQCIRKEFSLFVTILQAIHERDIGQSVMSAALLKEAAVHLQKTGELLQIARQNFMNCDSWERWLKEQCLIDQAIADHYIKLAQHEE